MPGSPRVQPGDKYNLSYAAVVTKSFDDIAALTQSPPCTTLTIMSAELPGSAAGLPGFPPPSPPPSPPPQYDKYDNTDDYDYYVGALDDDGGDSHSPPPQYDKYDNTDDYDYYVGASDDDGGDSHVTDEQIKSDADQQSEYDLGDTEDEERSGVKSDGDADQQSEYDLGDTEDEERSGVKSDGDADQQSDEQSDELLSEEELTDDDENKRYAYAKTEEWFARFGEKLAMYEKLSASVNVDLCVAMMGMQHMQMCKNARVIPQQHEERRAAEEAEERRAAMAERQAAEQAERRERRRREDRRFKRDLVGELNQMTSYEQQLAHLRALRRELAASKDRRRWGGFVDSLIKPIETAAEKERCKWERRRAREAAKKEAKEAKLARVKEQFSDWLVETRTWMSRSGMDASLLPPTPQELGLPAPGTVAGASSAPMAAATRGELTKDGREALTSRPAPRVLAFPAPSTAAGASSAPRAAATRGELAKAKSEQ